MRLIEVLRPEAINLDMQYLLDATVVVFDEARLLRERPRQARSREEVLALIAASPVEA